MRMWNVWIYDSESGCDQPIKVKANTLVEAKAAGNKYIKMWTLKDAYITKIEEIKEKKS